MSDETKVFPAIDPAIFRRQMETFNRMREIDAEARRVEKQREERRAASAAIPAPHLQPVRGRAGMNIWRQREQRVPLADSTTTEYRYCLDALIATIEDMKRVDEEFFVPGEVIERAEERAADLAHRL
ncbi:MAG TPA: hypothetical protein VF161_12675, partial [Steroidobacteraceae bacterium]